jgi:hypothetical protein
MLGLQLGGTKCNLGNGLGDHLPNWDFPLEGGGGGGESKISGVVRFLENFRGDDSLTGGISMWGGASVGGVLSLIFVPLEDMTHTCA